MRAARTDLVLVASLALLSALVVALPGGFTVVRAAAAVALVLALPGYALTAAILPLAAVRPAERVLLSIALSVAATILSGLVLHVAGVRLEALVWALTLAAITLAGTLVAQRHGHARTLAIGWLGLRGREVAALCGAGLLLAAAAALGFTPLKAPDSARGTTALWVVPRGAGVVELGVRSSELRPLRYLVEVRVGDTRARRLRTFQLRPGQTWQRALTTAARSPRVTVALRLVADPSRVYRRVELRRAAAASPAAPPRPACPAGHPLRSGRGCYRFVLRGDRAYRYYRDGKVVGLGTRR